jgi:hypothetical protein
MASKQAAQRPKKQRVDKPQRNQAVRGKKPANVERSPIYPSIPESDFLAAVTELAGLAGWLVYHTYDSRRSQAGFPDLVLVRGDKLIFAELKTDKGTVRDAQIVWLNTLSKFADSQTAVEVYLWRPKDWAGIEKILTA